MESEKFFREIIGFSIIIVSLFMALSLVSYHPEDSSIFHSKSSNLPLHNWFGPLGASTAGLFFQLFGVISFAFPVIVFVTGLRWFFRPGSRFVLIRLLGFLLIIVSLPAFSAMLTPEIPWKGQNIATGGWFGETIYLLFTSLFNPTGSAVILGFLVLLGLFFWTSLGPSEYFRKLTEVFGRMFSWVKLLQRSARRRKKNDEVVNRHYRKMEDSGIIITKKDGAARLQVRQKNNAVISGPGGKRADEAKKHRETSSQKQLSLTPPKKHEYVLPPVALLDPSTPAKSEDARMLVQLGKVIEKKLAEFQINGQIAGINPGPVVTVFEFKPAAGIKISRILGYQDDLAMALKTTSIRVERIPNRSTVGIEVPNSTRQVIRLRDIVEGEEYTRSPSLLTVAMGVDIRGEPVVSDITIMPHLLVGGTTGSGKSVGLHALIMSILLRATPEQVKLILVDPKRVEMKSFDHIPHLMTPIISSPKKAAQALAWAVSEMENRYKLLAKKQVRNIHSYNKAAKKEPGMKLMPYIIVVIDELADLLMVASKEVEDLIVRLAQMARAVGIHLVLATQRPDKNVVTGLIKANIPARIAYTVSSGANSRVILDSIGAEKLLGQGDMLFIPPGTSRKQRLHGPFVSEVEIARVTRYICAQKKPEFQDEVTKHPVPERKGSVRTDEEEVNDELFFEAVREVIQSQQASASHLQRRLRVGYARAARLVDLMEAQGVVGPGKGSKPRDILVGEEYLHMLSARMAGEDAG